MSNEQDAAPGWDAIDDALRTLYGDQEPRHFGTIVPFSLGGKDPIYGISAYKVAAPRPYWHIVTYGFSELWQKEWDDPEVSGFGFELTLRVACGQDDENPPNWSLNFLQNLGRYVFQSGNAFGGGHTMSLNGPICLGADTKIRTIGFIRDPQLGVIHTPNGRVEFLQIAGLTLDELDAIQAWNAEGFLGLVARHDPWLITDLNRASWLSSAEIAGEVERRTRAEGSSCEGLFVAQLSFTIAAKLATVRFQSIVVESLRRRLLGRIPFGRRLCLWGEDASVRFEPSGTCSWRQHGNELDLAISETAARQLADTLRPLAGRYEVPDIQGLTFEVLRTEVTNEDGDVVDVVG